MTAAPTDRTPSIRRRLLVTLFLPAAAVLIAGTVSDYASAMRPFTEAFDLALLDSALAIAAHVHADASGHLNLALPPDALAVVRADSQDSIYFKVSTQNGTLIAGDADLPDPPAATGNPSHVDTSFRGAPVRLIGYKTYEGNDAFSVTMGETTNKRDQLRESILLGAVATDILVLGLILALIWNSVRMSLEPLRAVERQVSRRSARDLTPIGIGPVPAEIRSLVSALNRLFRLVRDTATSQRQFLDNAAHQLRTPLAGIQAQLELLCAEEHDPERLGRLTRILDGARRLTRTTQELLTLARADESASPTWELEDVDLTSIVESAVADCFVSAEAAGIDLGAQTSAATVNGVDWLLTEAVKSLVSNAIVHTPSGGSVTVGCGVRDSVPYLEVVDTGEGIPAAERARVVDRFFRGSNARGDGSGLGLAIVKEVTTLHDGMLAIEDAPGGVGTCVRINFPRRPSAEPRESADAAGVLSAAGRG